MAKPRGLTKGMRRRRVSPAPGLHPPGMASLRPHEAGLRLEPRSDVERRFLQHVTRQQVRGQAFGWPDMMRVDWDRMKLQESLWLNDRLEKTPVDVIKLARSRAMRAQFNGHGRVVSVVTKAKEARRMEPSGKERTQGQRGQAKAAPCSEQQIEKPRPEVVQESPFMKTLRLRAFALAAMGQERQREQDPE